MSKHTIGSPEWENQILTTLKTQINALMNENKDMRALGLSKVYDDLKIYFKEKK